MAPPRSRLTAQGQVSIPAEVRRSMSLAPGERIEWVAHGEGFMVRKAGGVDSAAVHRALFGGAAPKARASLKEGIRQHLRRKHAGD